MATQTNVNRNRGRNRPKDPDSQRWEPYILAGHINLHKSDANNAQFVNYINNANSMDKIS